MMAERMEQWAHYDSVRPSPVPGQCLHLGGISIMACRLGWGIAQSCWTSELVPQPCPQAIPVPCTHGKIAETSEPFDL